MRAVCVNQDPGVGPGRAKGAAIHLRAMRDAFASLGVPAVAVDDSDGHRVRARLDAAWSERPFDLIYERYALGRSAAAEFACRRRVPLVLEVNSPLAEEQRIWRGRPETTLDRQRDRFLFETAAAVIAVSEAVAEYARARGARAESIRVFPNGVDRRLFRPRAEDDPLRAALVPGGRLALGFHGRLRPWHGFDRLARACARLVARDLPIHLVVVGKGEFEADLEGRLPADRYTLVGWQPYDRIGRYVATFDALPLAYGIDAPCYFSPLKLPEAMACGAVPVVPELGDLPATVGDAGLVYAAGDDAALATALEKLIAGPELRARLRRRAIERAQQLSWERIAAFAVEHASPARNGGRS